MTHLYDDPAEFVDDALAGFLDLYPHRVVGVPGGAVRAQETPRGKVAVVVGGGSGHYPAFYGVVGPGFADGAVVGNVFTSPSAHDAVSVASAAMSDAGVVFITGNYAGDVMNFSQAAEQMRASGIDARVVFVTDDIASAPAEQAGKRRGIAGDFVVFKVAGAAGDAGLSVVDVERVARLANDRTRTLGVAFSGCTLPGARAPLFTVPEGRIGVGLGIHGEPGIAEDEMPTAAQLAERLVDGVLAEVDPLGSRRIGVVLNGLGSTKHEELFVVWRTVAGLLRRRGYIIVAPEVGELVTSLDMAGCSLTVVALDEELERLWLAPADTPAFRRGHVPLGGDTRCRPVRVSASATEVAEPEVSTSDAARSWGASARAALEAMRVELVASADRLGGIDAVAGDGDHGRGMTKGISAATAAISGVDHADAGIGRVLRSAGRAWADAAGGTSGVLWGAALGAAGRSFDDGAETLSGEDLVSAVHAAREAITSLGKAAPGDKTMLDALIPFADALAEKISGGQAIGPGWLAAAQRATVAAEATAGLVPRVGRARPLAERSIGTPDPGAVSLALAVTAIGAVLADCDK